MSNHIKDNPSGGYDVLFDGEVVSHHSYRQDAEGYLNRRIRNKGKPVLISLMKKIAVCMMVTPILALAYHKGLSEYVGLLWPTATTGATVFTGILSLIASFVSGIFISLNWGK